MPLPMESAPEIYVDFNNLIPGENPLSDGGRWTSYSSRPPLKVGDEGGAIHGTVEFAINGSLYVGKTFNGPVVEAYGCRPESGLGAAVESHRIVALYGDPDVYNGYSSAFGGGIGEYYFFRLYTNFSFEEIGTAPGLYHEPPFTAPRPNKLGIRILPDRVEQWGWTSPTGWFLVQTHFGTEHRGTVQFALETEEQGGIEEVAWTCFGGWLPNRQQIYRILKGLE